MNGDRPATGIAINGRFLAASRTGVQRVAEEVVRALDGLAREGRAPQIRMITPPETLWQVETAKIPVTAIGRRGGQFWEQWDLPRAAGPDTLLNLCNMGPLTRRRCVTMIHDAQVFSAPGSYSRAFRGWYHFAQPMIGRRHDRVLTVSEFSRSELVRHGVAPAERITVVPNGVDHMSRIKAEPGASARLGLAPGGYVLALSTTQTHKNIEVLLRAFADPALAGLRLALFGSANREDFIAAGLPVPEGVVFLGRVSDETLRGLMEEALCLGFPSTTEGFGLPPLEAMRVGCPAIIAPCGALPEVCGEAALQAGPEDPRAWIAAILSLGDPARREEYVRRGQAWSADFTWRRAAEIILEASRPAPASASPTMTGAA